MVKLLVAFRIFAKAPKKLPPPRARERERADPTASAAGSMATSSMAKSSAERRSEGRGVVLEWR